MLHVVDTSTTPTGEPANEIIASVDLCRDPSNLAVADLAVADPDAEPGAEPVEDTRVYVACFPEGQVWAIDPEAGVVEAILAVGGGPNALTVDQQRKRLYVGGFLDHSMTVVDLDPASPARNQVVLRLRSSQEGDN
jgi:sugar lactone lactonase YvrE